MTAKRRKAGVPHRVVNLRNIPEFATLPDGTVAKDDDGNPIRIPVVTIDDVHYYEGDVVTEISAGAERLIERGFLVPADGGETEVDGDG